MNAEVLIGQKCRTPEGKLVAVERVLSWAEGAPRRVIVRYLEPVDGSGYASYLVNSLRPLDPKLQDQEFV
jgi:hypothetical protein